MSVQFGRWQFDGQRFDHGDLDSVHRRLREFGPDGEGRHCGAGIEIFYYAFHTTFESRCEAQPYRSPSDAIITFDGRLDNRDELVLALADQGFSGEGDVEIVAASYERWGTECLHRVLGDWALSIWDPRQQTLILARDFLGARHLYYSISKDRVFWSTVIDPLILLARSNPQFDEAYIAGWLSSSLPRVDQTPYEDIFAVPPACTVVITPHRKAIRKYWDFDPGKQIRYRSDSEYEEHFRDAFGRSVLRRLRSDSPIAAELSGGMDSSAIVCVADRLIQSGASAGGALSTVSYYDDSEPHWNERPYFELVERQRGWTGLHIDACSSCGARPVSDANHVALMPGSMQAAASGQLRDWMLAGGYRVLLSGLGGDEVLGGVPTPVPELADLLARARLSVFSRRLFAFALQQRKPWIHLLWEVLREFLPGGLVRLPEYEFPASWLRLAFIRRNQEFFRPPSQGFRWFGPTPSFQENLRALEGLRRQLACACLLREPLYEKRYPYLDRTLLEFLYAIPREQFVRPQQRKSLMRRSLAGIVPAGVLNRKRKAYTVRAPIRAVRDRYLRLTSEGGEPILSSLGYVESRAFREEYSGCERARSLPAPTFARALALEEWLKALRERGLLAVSGDAAHIDLETLRMLTRCKSPENAAEHAPLEA